MKMERRCALRSGGQVGFMNPASAEILRIKNSASAAANFPSKLKRARGWGRIQTARLGI